MMRNEQTGKRVAKIAARILAAKYMICIVLDKRATKITDVISINDLKTLAASALTQTPDQGKTKRAKKGKRRKAKK